MSVELTPSARLKKLLFSFSRVSCIEYMGLISIWSAIMCLVLIEATLLIISPSFIGAGPVTRDVTNILTYAVLAIGSIIVMLNFILIAIRRLHDCNYRGWWWFLMLIPGVGFFLGLMLLVVPGSQHENRFGAPPPKANWFNFALFLLGPVAFGILLYLLRSLIF